MSEFDDIDIDDIDIDDIDDIDDMLQRSGIEVIKRPKIVKTKVYLHSSKESMAENGVEIGLEGEALDRFVYTFYEVAFDVEVNTETGEAFATAIDSVPLKEKVPIN